MTDRPGPSAKNVGKILLASRKHDKKWMRQGHEKYFRIKEQVKYYEKNSEILERQSNLIATESRMIFSLSNILLHVVVTPMKILD